MDGMDNQTTQETSPDTEVNPWEQAFAAINQETEKDSEESADTVEGGTGSDDNGEGSGVSTTERSDDGEHADDTQGEHSSELQATAGGPGDLGAADGDTSAGSSQTNYEELFHFTDDEVKEYKESLTKSVEEQTLRDVARAYIDKGYRHNNGKLGASIYDEDICRRDEDGVPRFYNPDTGREFSGDNPRRQAQEWVEDYNRELANAFNKTCADYSAKLMDERGAGLAVIEFAPKYEKLDPMRRAMFESIIEDYEIRDADGDITGYSINLDKALSAVNRQVKAMQTRFGNKAATQTQASGPALDMKSTPSSKDTNKKEFKSIAEAMEYQQDQLLKKMKEGK